MLKNYCEAVLEKLLSRLPKFIITTLHTQFPVNIVKTQSHKKVMCKKQTRDTIMSYNKIAIRVQGSNSIPTPPSRPLCATRKGLTKK